VEFVKRVVDWIGGKMADHTREAARFKDKHPLTPHAKGLWEEQSAICATTRYEFRETGSRCYTVRNLETGTVHTVTWDDSIEGEWSCVCSSFIDYRCPCRHCRVVMHNIHVVPMLADHVRRFWPRWARSEVYHAAYARSGVRYLPLCHVQQLRHICHVRHERHFTLRHT
jgi:hypothetical protein